MPTKPASLPKWASSGTNIVEPTEGKKQLGYVASERPPAGWWNWFQNLVWQWLTWFTGGMRFLPWYLATSIASTAYDWQIAFIESAVAGGTCYAMAITVASGVTTVRRSIDAGQTWAVSTLANSVASSAARSIASNGSRAVLVGDNGLIQYCASNGSWLAATAAQNFTGTFYQVIWTGLQFVAVGDFEVQTSPDGISWVRRQSVAPVVTGRTITNLRAIAYAGGRLVRVGVNSLGTGEVFYSDDSGGTWTWWYTTALGADALTKVIGTVYADGTVGFAASAASRVYYTNNAGTWTLGGAMLGVVNFAYDDVLVAGNGQWATSDGTNWFQLPGGAVPGIAYVTSCAQSKCGFALVGRQVSAGVLELARTPVQRFF